MTLARAALLAALLLSRVAYAEPPVVAAAADLRVALPEIAALFTRNTGHEVRLVFGSSGNFAQQIANGAPFELFLSADESYVAQLDAKGLTKDAGRRYAVGRIALFIPQGSRLKADPGLADVVTALADGRLRRFAIANPEHAPYGRAAREALERAGAWPAIQPRLVLGENVAQALQFATSGAADGGIVALSLALSPQTARLGTVVALPAASHAPLRQRMVLLRRAGPEATAFYVFLQSPAAQAILAGHGFAPPDGN